MEEEKTLICVGGDENGILLLAEIPRGNMKLQDSVPLFRIDSRLLPRCEKHIGKCFSMTTSVTHNHKLN